MLWRGLSGGAGLEYLSADECWQLLRSGERCRLCFCVDHRVQVAIAPYAARADRIFIRTGAFGTLARRVLTRPVTVEVDDLSGNQEPMWAITVTGAARSVSDAATLAELWTPVRPAPQGVGQESLWLELTPDVVHGQRLRT